MDGLCSNITYMYVTVDTVAPQIFFDNEYETYEEGIYLHEYALKTQLKFGWTVNMSICRMSPILAYILSLRPANIKWYSSSMIGVETKQPKKLCFKGT